MNNTTQKTWTPAELDQWFNTLVPAQANQILEALKKAAAKGQDVHRLATLIRNEMESRNITITKATRTYDLATAIFNGYQHGIIQWRLYSGNNTN